jgi:hypothetical protein
MSRKTLVCLNPKTVRKNIQKSSEKISKNRQKKYYIALYHPTPIPLASKDVYMIYIFYPNRRVRVKISTGPSARGQWFYGRASKLPDAVALLAC